MKRYLYVAVYQDQAAREPIRFAHCFVEANDESRAYDLGWLTVEASGDGLMDGEICLNDYVVELGPIGDFPEPAYYWSGDLQQYTPNDF